MTNKELAIIEAAKAVPMYNGYGYKLVDSLYRGIARIMGYEIITFRHGDWKFRNIDERKKTVEIVKGMAAKGIIKMSKSGMAYKIQ